MRDCLLMVFVKNPVEGEVKTRLAESIGDRRALVVYRKLLRHLGRILKKAEMRCQVWYSDYIPETSPLYLSDACRQRLQQGEGLGERMKHAFMEAFNDGDKRVVIIGSDCPGINKDILEHSFDLLRENDAVIGPSNDGGYYLLGLTAFYEELFTGIPWSTPEVYEKTVEKFESLGLQWQAMSERPDVDTIEDWNLVRDQFE